MRCIAVPQTFCTLPRFCLCIKFKMVAQTTWQSKHSTITQKNRCVNSLTFCWLVKQPCLRVRPGHNISDLALCARLFVLSVCVCGAKCGAFKK